MGRLLGNPPANRPTPTPPPVSPLAAPTGQAGRGKVLVATLGRKRARKAPLRKAGNGLETGLPALPLACPAPK